MITQVKKISLLPILFLFVGVFLTSFSTESSAEENGGIVKSNGVVGFYEDSSSSNSSSLDSNTPTSSEISKPTGRLPSTGELVKKSLSITIGILLLVFVLFLLFKRKKKQDEGGKT